MSDFELSVVIPTYERGALLCDTLASVLAQRGVRYEVIVIDQTVVHDGATMDYLKGCAERDNVLIVREPYANLPHARNVGICAARAPLVLFLDDDVELPDGLFIRFLKAFDDAAVDAIGGALLRPGESIESLPMLPVSERSARNRLDLPLMRFRGRVRGALHLAGACLAVRREWLVRANGFDHSFRGSALAEDVEFVGRLRRLGGNTLYDSELWLIHRAVPNGGTRARPLPPYRRQRERMGNFYYAIFHGVGVGAAVRIVTRRWKNRIFPPAFREGLSEGSNARREARGILAPLRGRSAGALDGIVAAWKERGKAGDLVVAAERIDVNFEGGRLPMVSAIIATYGRPGPLRRAVESLLAQGDDLLEIIIADQSSETPVDLPNDEKVAVLRLPKPNASHARNVAAVIARGDILLFMDDDAEALPGMIIKHAVAMRGTDVGCVGGLVIAEGTPGRAGAQFPLPHWTARQRMDSPVCYHATPFPDALHLITCNLSVRRDAFVRVGGFCEFFAGYGEDIDLVARLRREGFRAAYEPDATVVHRQAPSGGTRAGRKDFGWHYRRAVSNHLSEMRVAGIAGWIAVEFRRQHRRIAARFVMKESAAQNPSGAPAQTRSILKPICELLAIPNALLLRLAMGKPAGDYAATSKELRERHG